MMANGPIRIDANIEQLFGEDHLGKLSEEELLAIENIIGDGLIDENDKPNFQNKENNASVDNTRFVKGFRYALEKFAKDDGNGLKIDVDSFKDWIQKSIPTKLGIYEVNNPTPIDGWRIGILAFVMADDIKYPRLNPNFLNAPDKNYKRFNNSEDGLLIVTHPSKKFDPNGVTTSGIDREVRQANERGNSTVYLVQSTDNIKNFPLENSHPDYLLASTGGEAAIQYDGSYVIVAGGFDFWCQANTVSEILHNRESTNDLEIELPVDAVLTATTNSKKIENLEDKIKLNQQEGKNINDTLDRSAKLYAKDLDDKYNFKVCYENKCHDLKINDDKNIQESQTVDSKADKPTVTFNFTSEK